MDLKTHGQHGIIHKITQVKAPRSVAQVSTRLSSRFLVVSLFLTGAPDPKYWYDKEREVVVFLLVLFDRFVIFRPDIDGPLISPFFPEHKCAGYHNFAFHNGGAL